MSYHKAQRQPTPHGVMMPNPSVYPRTERKGPGTRSSVYGEITNSLFQPLAHADINLPAALEAL